MTIREMVQEIQGEIAKGNVMPERAAELLTQLAALLGNVNERMLECDMSYNKALLFWLENEIKANKAKIHAECTPEYRNKIEARNTKELTLELIRSLKYFLKAREDEFRVAKYQ